MTVTAISKSSDQDAGLTLPSGRRTERARTRTHRAGTDPHTSAARSQPCAAERPTQYVHLLHPSLADVRTQPQPPNTAQFPKVRNKPVSAAEQGELSRVISNSAHHLPTMDVLSDRSSLSPGAAVHLSSVKLRVTRTLVVQIHLPVHHRPRNTSSCPKEPTTPLEEAAVERSESREAARPRRLTRRRRSADPTAFEASQSQQGSISW